MAHYEEAKMKYLYYVKNNATHPEISTIEKVPLPNRTDLQTLTSQDLISHFRKKKSNLLKDRILPFKYVPASKTLNTRTKQIYENNPQNNFYQNERMSKWNFAFNQDQHEPLKQSERKSFARYSKTALPHENPLNYFETMHQEVKEEPFYSTKDTMSHIVDSRSFPRPIKKSFSHSNVNTENKSFVTAYCILFVSLVVGLAIAIFCIKKCYSKTSETPNDTLEKKKTNKDRYCHIKHHKLENDISSLTHLDSTDSIISIDSMTPIDSYQKQNYNFLVDNVSLDGLNNSIHCIQEKISVVHYEPNSENISNACYDSHTSSTLHSSKYSDNINAISLHKEINCREMNEADFSSLVSTPFHEQQVLTLLPTDWIPQSPFVILKSQSDTALETFIEAPQAFGNEVSLSECHLQTNFKDDSDVTENSDWNISNNESQQSFVDALSYLSPPNIAHNRNKADLMSDIDQSNLETVNSTIFSSSLSSSDESVVLTTSYRFIPFPSLHFTCNNEQK